MGFPTHRLAESRAGVLLGSREGGTASTPRAGPLASLRVSPPRSHLPTADCPPHILSGVTYQIPALGHLLAGGSATEPGQYGASLAFTCLQPPSPPYPLPPAPLHAPPSPKPTPHTSTHRHHLTSHPHLCTQGDTHLFTQRHTCTHRHPPYLLHTHTCTHTKTHTPVHTDIHLCSHRHHLTSYTHTCAHREHTIT